MADLLVVARAEFVRLGYSKATMAGIAATAGLTKRTLYLWHENKAALFLSCIQEGATRFPQIKPDEEGEIELLLRRHLERLVIEFAREDANAMGRIFLREGADFPELVPMIQQSYAESILNPLADFLQNRKIEKENSIQSTKILLSMALMPIHNNLLLGESLPNLDEIRSHVNLITNFFIRGISR